MALSLSDFGSELAKRQCYSRRTIKKNGGSDEDATRSADQWKQINGRRQPPKKWKQPEGEDRSKMKKEARRLRCTFLSGSARSTEKST